MKKIIEDKLVCPICKAEKIFLGIHLSRVHNILPDEAKRIFGLESLTSKSYCLSRSGGNNSFYGKVHTDKSKDKMLLTRDGKHYEKRTPPLCKGNCGRKVLTKGYEYCQKCAAKIKNSGDNNPAKRPEVRVKLVENHAAYGPNAEIRAERISDAKIGTSRPDMLGENNVAKRPEVRKKISQNNPMKNHEVVRRQIASAGKKPNWTEQHLFNIISKLLPNEYQLNVCAEVLTIEHKIPDYVCLSKNKVIEFFGEKWHKQEHAKIRVDLFRSKGWDTLIIWGRELKNTTKLMKRILKFHAKGRLNEHNQNVSNEMVVCSDLYGDIEKLAEMTNSLSIDSSNKSDIPLFATPTLTTADLFSQKGFLSSAAFKVVNAGMFCKGTISHLGGGYVVGS